MPQYKVLGGRWGEGWIPGQIINMDEQAAKLRVEKGDLEYVGNETEFTPPPKEEALKDIMRDNLLLAKECLDKNGIKFWLEAGTCLGAIRDNGFILNLADIDLGVYEEDVKNVDNLIIDFQEKGFEMYNIFGTRDKGYEVSFIKNNIKVDVFFFYKKGKKRWHGAYYRKQLIPHIFPAHLVERLKQIDFCGEKFNVPYWSKKYLVARYGDDWETPRDNWNYWEDPKCIDMNFVCD